MPAVCISLPFYEGDKCHVFFVVFMFAYARFALEDVCPWAR
jgi:hypothetical protein